MAQGTTARPDARQAAPRCYIRELQGFTINPYSMQYSYAAFFALLFTAAALPARSQAITIDRNDMPNLGDSLRVSETVLLTGPALTQNGANQTWNYSGLRPLVQSVPRYAAINTTPALLQLAFGPLGGANRATIVNRQQLPAALVAAGLPANEVFVFFNESAADYRQVGYGVEITPGVALPAFYQNQAAQDVLYRFPLTYQQRDSSSSDFTANAPGLAFLRETQKRVNYADGWGTLITPFGTFDALRVVSTVRARDSVSVQGVPGMAVQQPVAREYKWLGKNQGIPLLQVTTRLVAGREVVTQVQYRDIYRRLPVLSTQPQLPETAVAAYPNPVGLGQPLRITLPTAGAVTLTATDITGRLIFRQTHAAASRELLVPAAAFGAFRGVAVVRVQTETGVAVRRVVRE